MNKFYTGKYDIVFKTIICNQEEPYMLKEFLKRLLKKNIDEIEYKDKERGKKNINEKGKILDFLAKVDGEIIHVELNVRYNNYIHIRNFAYFTEVYSKITEVGEKYTDEIKFLHIDLTYGSKDNTEYKEYYVMSKDTSKYIENFKIIEYNMDRLMGYWIDKNKEKIEEYKHLIMLDFKDKELTDISKGDEFMENYEKKLNSLNESDVFKSLMTPEEDYQKILNTERYLGEKEGLEKGGEGRRRKKSNSSCEKSSRYENAERTNCESGKPKRIRSK